MTRSKNGLPTSDPFFERMMDERIATLRAFLKMTSEKYQVPEKPGFQPVSESSTGTIRRPANDGDNRSGDNVIMLRHKL